MAIFCSNLFTRKQIFFFPQSSPTWLAEKSFRFCSFAIVPVNITSSQSYHDLYHVLIVTDKGFHRVSFGRGLTILLSIFFARWEDNPMYCKEVVMKQTVYSTGRRMLDIIDLAIFDFLMGEHK